MYKLLDIGFRLTVAGKQCSAEASSSTHMQAADVLISEDSSGGQKPCMASCTGTFPESVSAMGMDEVRLSCESPALEVPARSISDCAFASSLEQHRPGRFECTRYSKLASNCQLQAFRKHLPSVQSLLHRLAFHSIVLVSPAPQPLVVSDGCQAAVITWHI